ncbi:aspartate carbamoyltransferase [Boudabousia tangfeifanii]|uniref:Aspartate carbamoyltransferase n=1 Tax=Boudabousia tangfeifanii TaxID=1912795 RepID=A0A1D9MKC8_9ACTO|nr:aspartate carbamoyltransferase catalytic subunit [Boudabousia tangfeifanii]AOZ72620.1 aspartate carbamoyltransferase [Boudabousia tangfeifanii]
MKHLLSTFDLSKETAVALLDHAEELASRISQDRQLDLLAGKTVANLFFEDSTRTRLSFELAAHQLGARVMNFSAAGSSISKGESLKDTAQTLAAMTVDAMVIRHRSAGAADRLAHAGWIEVPILNAGDGAHEHPTQALLDAMALRRHHNQVPAKEAATKLVGADLSGARVLIVGDLLHSRVVRSNVALLNTLGAEVALVAPHSLLPAGVETWQAEVFTNFDEALASNPTAVMMLRVQKERMSSAGGGFFPSVGEYVRAYGLTDERFRALDPKVRIMHPGPINRGLELSDLAADNAQAIILEQVGCGVAVRMAALDWLVNGENN